LGENLVYFDDDEQELVPTITGLKPTTPLNIFDNQLLIGSEESFRAYGLNLAEQKLRDNINMIASSKGLAVISDERSRLYQLKPGMRLSKLKNITFREITSMDLIQYGQSYLLALGHRDGMMTIAEIKEDNIIRYQEIDLLESAREYFKLKEDLENCAFLDTVEKIDENAIRNIQIESGYFFCSLYKLIIYSDIDSILKAFAADTDLVLIEGSYKTPHRITSLGIYDDKR